MRICRTGDIISLNKKDNAAGLIDVGRIDRQPKASRIRLVFVICSCGGQHLQPGYYGTRQPLMPFK